MSELINNREYRQEKLRELIMELHNGKSVEEVKQEFEVLIEGISPLEISEMEQALIQGGMPVEEIQRLCDVHAAVFKGSIEDIHRPNKPEEIKGHPVHTFFIENRAIEKLVEKLNMDLNHYYQTSKVENKFKLLEDLNLLSDIDKHYGRKENLIFPYMEKYGITAPPKVMWGVDDEIRAELKTVKTLLSTAEVSEEIYNRVKELFVKINEMIYKEEKILFPMVTDIFSEDEWKVIDEDSVEIGYCLTEPEGKWIPHKSSIIEVEENKSESPSEEGFIKFETGIMTTAQISAVFSALPFDITFVDKDGVVKYFSQGKERIFPRTKSVIGREVSNCHPPASVHIVEKIVEDLKCGRKDHEDFWISLHGKLVYIRYFAVRNEAGEFLGTLEVTQDIKPIQELTGEKRLMS